MRRDMRNKKAAHKLAAEPSDADLTSWDYSGWVRCCQYKRWQRVRMMDAAKWLLLIWALFGFSHTGWSQTVRPSFSITITAPATIKEGAQAKVEIEVKNTSNHTITFGADDLSHSEKNFAFEVRDSAGKLAPETRYMKAVNGEEQGPGPRMVILNHLGSVTLKAGETLKGSANLTELFELQPGQYTVQLWRVEGDHMIIDPAKPRPIGATVKSNVVSVSVNP
jgi:hypothetical protein